MISVNSIVFWITLFMSGLAIAYPQGEGDHTLGQRNCGEADSLCTLYNAAIKGRAGAANDDGSAIIPRAVVNPNRGTSDASLGQRVGGFTTVVVAGTLVWAFAM